jgi:hypothetical protein
MSKTYKSAVRRMSRLSMRLRVKNAMKSQRVYLNMKNVISLQEKHVRKISKSAALSLLLVRKMHYPGYKNLKSDAKGFLQNQNRNSASIRWNRGTLKNFRAAVRRMQDTDTGV